MAETSRRQFLQYGIGAGAMLSFPSAARRGLMAARGLAAPAASPGLQKYVERLPVLGAGLVVAAPSGKNRYSFRLREISRQLNPQLPPTAFWAYDDGSGLAGQAGMFGMVVVAQAGTPLRVSYTHGLPATYPAWIPVDTRLTPLGDAVRILTHLHGGFVAADSDGNPALHPDALGPGQTQTVLYPNQLPQQSARLMWFHDHYLGATRLNVFAGLAGAYIVRDACDTGTEPNPAGIPGGSYEIPLVLEDRQFNADGTLLYPVSDIPGATWIGEYFGDAMLVNGKVWPFLSVEPRLYRFRVLNACNARITSLSFGGGARVWQIGAEGGLWDRPVRVSQLVLGPAERADVIVDFRGLAGQTLLVSNNIPAAPVSTPAQPLPDVMQIRVGTKVRHRGPDKVPKKLPGRAARLPAPRTTRYITLNEIDPDESTWFLNLNAAHFGKAPESTRAGAVEDWVYINLTGDTHPMHMHLVNFQVVGRTPFNAEHSKRHTAGRTACPAGSTRHRSRPGPCSRRPAMSGGTRRRSWPTPASTRLSGPSSTCLMASGRRRSTCTTATLSSTRTTT
jgi:spore coat protein A